MNPLKALFQFFSSAFGDAIRWLTGQRSMEALGQETVEGFDQRIRDSVTHMGKAGASLGELKDMAAQAKQNLNAKKADYTRHLANMKTLQGTALERAQTMKVTKERLMLMAKKQYASVSNALEIAIGRQDAVRFSLQTLDMQKQEAEAEVGLMVMEDHQEEVLRALVDSQLGAVGALDTGAVDNRKAMRKRLARKKGETEGRQQALDALLEVRGQQNSSMVTPLDDDEQAELDKMLAEMGLPTETKTTTDTSSQEATG